MYVYEYQVNVNALRVQKRTSKMLVGCHVGGGEPNHNLWKI